MKPNETVYAGDVQFAGWSDSHTQGPIIKLRLPSSDDLDKFRALTVAKGKQAGHLFKIAIVEMGEEGEPLPPPEPSKMTDEPAPQSRTKSKPGPYCMEAIDLCINPRFWKWMESETGVPVRSEAAAKQGMLSVLGIGSRKDIDAQDDVRDAFIDQFRIPFMHWDRETSR